jgi:hypothetical protein
MVRQKAGGNYLEKAGGNTRSVAVTELDVLRATQPRQAVSFLGA